MIGPYNNEGLVFGLFPASWGAPGGNAPASFNVGVIPSNPDAAWQAATLAGTGSGFGFVNDGANSHLNFDSLNDTVDVNNSLGLSDAGIFSLEFKVEVTKDDTFQMLFGQYVDANNYIRGFLGNAATNQISIHINKAGALRRVDTTPGDFADGLRTIHVIKNAATVSVLVDGAELTYSLQEAYNLGDFTPAVNLQIGNDNTQTFGWNEKMYMAAAYSNVDLTGARAVENHGLSLNMGIKGTNIDGNMILSPFGRDDRSVCIGIKIAV